MKNGIKQLVLQPRDITLLKYLARFRILDREQAALLSGFHSRSRVNVRLAKLRDAGLVVRFYTATGTGSRRSIYALSKRGAEEIQTAYRPLKWRSDSIILGNAFAAHQLALVDLYIVAAQNGEIVWRTPTLPLSKSLPIIPDAIITNSAHSFFVELDLGTESLSVFSRKAASYIRLAMSGEFHSLIPHPRFSVLVVASDETRLQALRRTIAKQTSKLFWFATVETIKGQGFWSTSWLRPSRDALSPPGE